MRCFYSKCIRIDLRLCFNWISEELGGALKATIGRWDVSLIERVCVHQVLLAKCWGQFCHVHFWRMTHFGADLDFAEEGIARTRVPDNTRIPLEKLKQIAVPANDSIYYSDFQGQRTCMHQEPYAKVIRAE